MFYICTKQFFMTDSEAQDLFDSIFPIGEERWVKLKYLDQKKCIKTFRVGQSNDKSIKQSEKQGFEVTAIGIRDEFKPQVNAIMDIRDDIMPIIDSMVDYDDYRIHEIKEIFKEKIKEISKRTIKDVPIDDNVNF